MAEINEGKKKIIAFYLPQYHTIPENDRWWGKGFTDWVNVKKAEPLFEGHYQPRVPLDNDYYDLSDNTVMVRQAALAKRYGLFGFCYYHYWFKDGKKLLEKPIEAMLKNQDIDFPFCLCWANENWTRNWDGGNREVLISQDYGDRKDWECHFDYLLDFFKDSRYMTFDGKPILLVYKPELIESFNKMIDYWRQRLEEEGLFGLVVIRQYPESYFFPNWKSDLLDYTVKFQPTFARYYERASNEFSEDQKGWFSIWKREIKSYLIAHGIIKPSFKMKHLLFWNRTKYSKISIIDYDKEWDSILNKEPYSEDLINGGFVGWDNTPRYKEGRVYTGSSPDKFRQYMMELIQKQTSLNSIFINAWNEWAEGAYLEPDEKYRYGYLEALKQAIETSDL